MQLVNCVIMQLLRHIDSFSAFQVLNEAIVYFIPRLDLLLAREQPVYAWSTSNTAPRTIASEYTSSNVAVFLLRQ